MSGTAAPSASPVSGLLSSLDPLGNQITRWGGDPLNLYGNASATGALFPSTGPNAAGYGANGAGMTLPAPNGNVNPILYSPASFAQRQPAAPGAYNAMVAQLAGPVYQPKALPMPAPMRNTVPAVSPAYAARAGIMNNPALWMR